MLMIYFCYQMNFALCPEQQLILGWTDQQTDEALPNLTNWTRQLIIGCPDIWFDKMINIK